MIKQLLADHPQEFSRDVNSFEWLARAQHYGLPTRLLDVTRNPLVALYFACKQEEDSLGKENTRREAGEVVVFFSGNMRKGYFDGDDVACLANLALLDARSKDALREQLLTSRELASKSAESDQEFEETYKKNFHDSEEVAELLRLVKKDSPNLKQDFHPDILANIISVMPRKLDERISAQSGAFLIFGLFSPETETRKRFLFESFETEEFYIAPKHKSRMLDDLRKIGISEEALFPSLERTAYQIKNGNI